MSGDRFLLFILGGVSQKIHWNTIDIQNKWETHSIWVGEISCIGQPAAEVVVCASSA